MARPFLFIFDWLSRHKKWTWTLCIFLLVLFATQASRIHYEEDISRFLPRNEENTRYQNLYRKMTAQNHIAVLFTSRDSTAGTTADSMEMAMETTGKEIRKALPAKHLQVTLDEQDTKKTLDFLYRHIPYLLTTEDYQRIDSALADKDFVKKQMTENRKLLLMPMGDMMMQTLQYDPLHLFTPVLGHLRNQLPGSKFHITDKYLFSSDGHYSMISFDSPYGPSETRHNASLSESLERIIKKTEKEYPSIHISAIGAPLIAVTNAQRIKTDSVICITVASLFILILLIWHYRRLSDIGWIILALAFGWLFALAGISLLKESISIIVLGIGSVIIGIAINYPLHFLDHIREVPDRKEALREMVPPLLIGNITTVAAFFCLVFLDAQAMKDLGIFGSLMLIGTILFVLIFLPVFAGPSHQQTHSVNLHSLDKIHIPCLLPGVIAITLIFGYLSQKTSFDSNLRHINYMTKEQRQDIHLLSPTTKVSPVYVISEGKTLDEALEKNEQTTVKLAGIPEVKKVNSISNILLSQKSQTKRLRQWNKFIRRKGHQLQQEINRQSAALHFSTTAFQPFQEIMRAEYRPLDINAFAPTTHAISANFITKDAGGYQIMNYVYTTDTEKVKSAFSSAFTSKDVSNQLVEILNHSFNYIGYVCGFVVFFFLWASFGSIELSVISFLPLAVAWIWILGIMQLFGVQFNIVNIILATFIFGQGDDYTIFITEGLMYEYATGRKRLDSYKNSVLISAILMFIGIGCLVFARHPALQSLGTVTVIGMATVVCMAYYLPALAFRWLTMKNGEKREVPVTLKRLVYSIFSFSAFTVSMFLFVIPYTWLYFKTGKINEKRKIKFHRFIQKANLFACHHIPGVKIRINNRTGEDFEKPAIIICNHQSHLDLVPILSLSPKMIFLTKDWVWHNPVYAEIIHKAEYYPINNGIEENIPKLRDLYKRGYCICIFPEGTRSRDGHIHRFHKGAFYLAEQLGADILPLYIHGAYDVMPRQEKILRPGNIYLETGSRIRPEKNVREQCRQIHRQYLKHYAALCQELETREYREPAERCRRIYQGK